MLMFYSILVQYYNFLTYITYSCYVGTNCVLLKYLGIKTLLVKTALLSQDSCVCRESFCGWYMFNVIKMHTCKQWTCASYKLKIFEDEEGNRVIEGLYLSVFEKSKSLNHWLQVESFLYVCVAWIISLVTMAYYPYLE